MSRPRVSVLLPVRDAARTLAGALHSLRAQTLADHEVVAVDDGSSDGSRELLERFAREDPRVKVLAGPRRGLVSALNRAAAEARAPLLARMDADDVSREDRLALQAERLRAEPELDVLGSRVRLVGDAAGEGMRAYVAWQNTLLDHEAIVRDLYVESPLAHPSVMMRGEAFLGLGGYRDFDGPEDYDLWLRAHARGLRFSKLAETLLLWRDPPARLSRTDPRYAPERFRALKLEALGRGPLAGGRAAVVWGAGRIGKGWARALLAAGHAVVAFVEVDPGKIGQVIHGARVVAVGEAGALRGPLHLAAVGQPGARGRIREAAQALGLEEPRDLVAVA